MPPRKDTGAQLKIGAIDRVLKTRRGVTLAELANELHVTQRSVCRYLAHMRKDLHLPIAHSAQRHYYYRDTPDQIDPREKAPSAAGAATPSSQGWNSQSMPVLEQVHEALYLGKKLVLTCLPPGLPAFVLHPYFLSRVSGELFLFGRRPQLKALVNLPLTQICAVEVLEETFTDELANGRKVRYGQGWLADGTRHSVCLKFPTWASWAARLKICAHQRLAGSGHHLTIRFLTDDLDEVRRFVVVLGEAVTVLEPAVLRSQLRAYLGSGREGYKPLPHDLDGSPS